MSLSKHVRHCRRCVALSRSLTESAAGRNAAENSNALASQLSDTGSINILNKTKMSIHNRLKLLSQLKEFFNKNSYDKNLQLILSKEWMDLFQKLTYAQIASVRKYPVDESRIQEQNVKKNMDEKDRAVQSVATLPVKEKAIPQQQLKLDLSSTVDSRDPYYYLPQVLSALMPKLTGKTKDVPQTPAVPKWKTNLKTSVTKNSIMSRTRHILTSIAYAESNASKWKRIEDLLQHIEQYPDARHHAVKDGAIRILLRTRESTKDEQIRGSIREALAVLGHVDSLPGRGIRILAIDGGGIRGVLVLEMLKKLEQLTGCRVHEMFDYICGVSTGAILSAVLAINGDDVKGGYKRKSLNEISELYKELSTRIFTQSTLRGTSSLVWSHSYYDTALWEQMLKEQLGNKDLIETTRDPIAPKFSAISAVVNHERVMAYVFRNYTIPIGVESQYMGSHKHKLWEAVRASAAAPSYFEEFKCGGYLHQDGGIMVNNPCAVAIHEAKQLWPNNSIQCVVSFGTGRTPFNVNNSIENKKEATASSWKDKFYKILDSATDTEGVHIMLNDLLPDHAYYRFNPYLTEMLTMVEIRPEKIAQLEQDAAMYIRRNEEKFHKAARVLMQQKTPKQKFVDWFKLQRNILGI
ncbi:calcium-independent phospholipase A2-gamma-like isoform X1 [Phymastichus coffea]|uniref:calcium-independent phospholipase A2-gamma-like isoform X1 n=2 Tax=Phymastichus coffea TaxID=108790 RepID=UPI00273BBAFA|nr:calcium-independent phospholipase A2-gamma-like isoform X1 [Phymastichus coffea]